MKKLLLIATLVGFGFAATAGELISASFLNARSIVISNTISITNLATTAGGNGTNIIGNEWTNLFNTKVVVTASNSSTTNDVTHMNLFNDVPLGIIDWQMRYGSYTNTANGAAPPCAQIHIRLVGLSGANASGTYVFQLLDKDKQPMTDRQFSFGVVPNTTTEVNMLTNLTATLLQGASYIRPKYFLAGDTDASSAVTIKAADFVFWVP